MHDNRETDVWLQGRLLVATPGMSDPRFQKAVILLCAHDAKGAMGFVINQELPQIPLATLLAELSIAPEGDLTGQIAEPCMLLQGGPVEVGQGYLLHSPEYERKGTLRFNEIFSLTATVEAVRDTISGAGPKEKLLVLGYSGWGAGQLEAELKEGSWLVVPATSELVFHIKADDKWHKALESLKIDPRLLSADIGHA